MCIRDRFEALRVIQDPDFALAVGKVGVHLGGTGHLTVHVGQGGIGAPCVVVHPVSYTHLDTVFGQEQYAQIPMAVVGIVMKFFQIVISIVVGMAAGCIPVVGFRCV